MNTQAQLTEDEEKIIISRVRSGDTQAFSHLVQRYQTPIYNLMVRMTRSNDTAYDLAQETFVRAFEKINAYDVSKAFFPWLYTLALNVGRGHLRKYRVENTQTHCFDEIQYEHEDPRHPENDYDRATDRHTLENALASLPEDMREALIMRYREEFSYQEIANVLDIGLSSAKMKIHRGLARLRSILTTEVSP
ncbi:RNA polymerase sigma factor [Desulfovibrio inopinatus]|uniref:RNA polymerase sigma factor n=1 Tax=Desulfovibrio inopinatus TaxID=102109 RepID=UPI0005510720|nr:RNA polymerase sigma factor [Desulfovibrio inopinatus]